MNTIKIEVGQYRQVDKGALKAFFTLILHPYGLKILDCRYFVQGEKKWFNFPQKEYKKKDGTIDYISLVSFLNKSHMEELKKKVVQALETLKPEDISNGKAQSQAAITGQASEVSDDSLPVWF